MLFQIQKLYLVPNSNFVLGLVNKIKKDNLVFDNLDLCYCDVSISSVKCFPLSQLRYNFGEMTLQRLL